jgi:xanthosine utilization system XapX-like protein
MKTREAFSITVRLGSLMAGLIVAIIGAYLFLSGLAIVADQKLLPGLLDILIGFLFVSFGWRIISFRRLSHDA